MPQFISSNPVTDTIRQNNELATKQALQNLQVNNMLAQDRLARGIASIYAEPAPVAPPPVTTTQPDYSLQQATPSVGFKPTGSVSGLQQGSALSGFTAPELAQNLPDRSVVTPQPVPPDTRAQRAMQLAANTPGGGEMALQLTQQQQSLQVAQRKERNARLDKVHELISTGDLQGAQRYAQIHGLNEVMPLFANPRALATVQSLGSFAHKQLGLDGRDAAAFSEAALKSMSEGKSYQDAFSDAYASIKGLPAPITHTFVDDAGNVTGISKYSDTAVPIIGARGRSSASLASGAGKSQTGARFASDAAGNTVITYRDGTSKYVTDPLGNKIPATERNIAALTASLVRTDIANYNTPDVEARRRLAEQVYGRQPIAPSPQANPQTNAGVVRQFVPGQGFVTK